MCNNCFQIRKDDMDMATDDRDHDEEEQAVEEPEDAGVLEEEQAVEQEVDVDAAVARAEEMVAERIAASRMTRDQVMELPTATLEDLRRLKDERLARAVPFPLKSIGVKVMLAPCNVTALMEIVGGLFNDNDTDQMRAAFNANMKMVVACMVDPVVENEEELGEMLRQGSADVMGLFTFCREISGVDDDVPMGISRAVEMAVDFTAATPSSSGA